MDEEEISEKEQRWLNIHINFVFGNSSLQTILYLLVSLILMTHQYGQFLEAGITYSTRVFLDSFAFYISFLYISKPIFYFVKYLVAMTPHSEYSQYSEYAYGSFWHKFFLLRVLIINSIIYGFATYYTHQYFFSF